MNKLCQSRLSTNSGHNYQSILNVIAHEFIHTVNNKINKNCNIWIGEGLALYLGNGDRSKYLLYARGLIPRPLGRLKRY